MSTQKQAPGSLSWNDLRQLPEDGRRFELWDGALHELSPGPSPRHQAVSLKLSMVLGLWAEGREGVAVFAAPLDVVFRAEAPAKVVQPDLVVLLPGGRASQGASGIVGAPDIAIEILSPSSVRHDLIRKADRYAQEGVQSYWVVRPDEGSIEVWPLADTGRWGPVKRFVEDMELEDPLLEGFSAPLTRIFGPQEAAPPSPPILRP